MPYSAWAPPGENRKPVTISSKINRTRCWLVSSRSTVRNGGSIGSRPSLVRVALAGLRCTSMKSGFFQALQQMVARRLRAELRSKTLGIEERRQTRDDGALAFGVLVSAHLGIGGSKYWAP
jgi:hypothetical protein